MAEADLHLKLDRILARQEEQAQRVADLNEAIQTLSAGLISMRTVQDTQTEMLRVLLQAAGDETGGGELAAVIARIEARLGEQSGVLHQLRTAVRDLPAQVEAATIGGVRLAIGDGVDIRP